MDMLFKTSGTCIGLGVTTVWCDEWWNKWLIWNFWKLFSRVIGNWSTLVSEGINLELSMTCLPCVTFTRFLLTLSSEKARFPLPDDLPKGTPVWSSVKCTSKDKFSKLNSFGLPTSWLKFWYIGFNFLMSFGWHTKVQSQISLMKIVQNGRKMTCQWKWGTGWEKCQTWYWSKLETNSNSVLICSLYFRLSDRVKNALY